ncbi:hypothetical protein CTAYLR_004277 [Chrysophaeum taylorii]|uniref:PH domain-containing protein n=1 Tax=Chrysophaeum taylorii TaxID=2483200 RepID=A0AAD7UFD8_9STRA|nr:hypothetical protein CTAYLR_004277 [Chrysophaeum taylorii]
MPEYWLEKDEEGAAVRVTGGLLKKGGSRGGRRNWSKRWFVLEPRGGRFRYYEDPKLLREAGVVVLLAESEIVVRDPLLKGRHAPSGGEDSYYFELHKVTDATGRPRPFPFALRAFTQVEYDDWLRSLSFCVRQLKPTVRRAQDVALVVFETVELGLSLALSREKDTGRTTVAVARTCPDKGDGVAHALLRPDDELVGLHETHDFDFECPEYNATPVPPNLDVAGFEKLLATVRGAPRPLGLVFKRRSPPKRPVPHIDDDDGGDDDGDEVLDDSSNLYVYDDHSMSFDKVDVRTIKLKFQAGDISPETKVFFADAWLPISAVPCLLAKLQQ